MGRLKFIAEQVGYYCYLILNIYIIRNIFCALAIERFVQIEVPDKTKYLFFVYLLIQLLGFTYPCPGADIFSGKYVTVALKVLDDLLVLLGMHEIYH